MKAPPFAYVRAATLADVFSQWIAAGPEAKLLAGGQNCQDRTGESECGGSP